MALLPQIPARPTDRLETFDEYESRRSVVAVHRQFSDDLVAWLRRAHPRAAITTNSGRLQDLGLVQDLSIEFCFDFKTRLGL